MSNLKLIRLVLSIVSAVVLAVACSGPYGDDLDVGDEAGSAAAIVFECTAQCNAGSGQTMTYDNGCQNSMPPASSFTFYYCDYSAVAPLLNNTNAQAHAKASCRAHGFADGMAVECHKPMVPVENRRGEPVDRREERVITCDTPKQVVDALHQCHFVYNEARGNFPIVDNAPLVTVVNRDMFPERFWGSDSWDAEHAAVSFAESLRPRAISYRYLDPNGKFYTMSFKPEHHRECGPAIDCHLATPFEIQERTQGGSVQVTSDSDWIPVPRTGTPPLIQD